MPRGSENGLGLGFRRTLYFCALTRKFKGISPNGMYSH